jgi:molecular chaperone GrpE
MTTFSKKLFRLSQKALFHNPHDGTYLLFKVAKPLKNKPHHALWTKKYGPWDLPGGHVDSHENDLVEAFAREVKEESGLEIGGDHILCNAVVMQNEKSEHLGINHIYCVTYDNGSIELSEEHIEYQWMSAEEIKKSKEIKEWIKESVQRSEDLIEMNESLNSWKRCLADFDNYKKRQIENQKEFTKYASEGVISDILPILDNFHAATEHVPESDANSPWVTGIMFIQQQMEKVLEEHGVIKIDVNVGDEFDPHMMEAIKNDEEEKLNDNAKVEKVAQPGYKIREKILRPARVLLK